MLSGLSSKVLLVAALLAINAFASDAARAKVLESTCNKVRAQLDTVHTRWFAIKAADELSPLQDGAEYSARAVSKIVYLHAREDQNTGRTVIAAKLIFSTQSNYIDQDQVRAQNNFKRNPISISYADYNAYENGSKENFDMQANFHLTKGGDIPFSTYSDGRRRQLLFPPNRASEERTYRAYLQNFEAISPRGSCVDFTPNFPKGTKQAIVETVDLLPTEAGDFYRDSITFKVSK